MSSEVAVEKMGIRITKLISSLGNTTEYLWVSIYYKVEGRIVHRPCLYMCGYSKGKF